MPHSKYGLIRSVMFGQIWTYILNLVQRDATRLVSVVCIHTKVFPSTLKKKLNLVRSRSVRQSGLGYCTRYMRFAAWPTGDEPYFLQRKRNREDRPPSVCVCENWKAWLLTAFQS
jgi:hypothetical protein